MPDTRPGVILIIMLLIFGPKKYQPWVMRSEIVRL